MKRTSIVLALFALVALTARSDAGQGQTTTSLYCYNSGSYGFCRGNFWSFHNQGQLSDYAYFSGASDGSMQQFSASLNGAYYSCYVPMGAPLQSWWPNALSANRFFSVQWSNGVCDWVWLENDSRQGQAW